MFPFPGRVFVFWELELGLMTVFPKFILLYQLPQPTVSWSYHVSHLEWLPGPGAGLAHPVTSHRTKVKGKQFQKCRDLRELQNLNLSIWEENIARATRECSTGSLQPSGITFPGLPRLRCEKELKTLLYCIGQWHMTEWNVNVHTYLQERGDVTDTLLHGGLKTRTQIPFRVVAMETVETNCSRVPLHAPSKKSGDWLKMTYQ